MRFKQDKSVAGLTIFLSLIVMLFVIGLLITVFSIMSAKLQQSQYTSTTGTAVNETVSTLTNTTGAGDYLSVYLLRDVVCSITQVKNATTNASIASGNYTSTNCKIFATPSSAYVNQSVKVDYSYTFNADNTATNAINATGASIANATDFFDIFIVIGSMVVLILLVVLIIVAIKGSGLMAGTTSGKVSGTA